MTWQRWAGIMKCYPFEEKRLAKWSPPYFVQPKYDGIRCRALKTGDGKFLLVSSEENPIFSVPHINEALDTNADQLPDELDGELYCHGKSFESIVSITSRTQNLHPDHQDIHYHIFDVVNQRPQYQRLLELEAIKELRLSPYFEFAPTWITTNLDEITKVYDILLVLDYEGIIVRHAMNMYERKRSTMVMKFKPKKEDTYTIIGVQEEVDKEGLPKGSLGAIVCASGDGNIFNVGTGFSAEQRQIFWEMREMLPGKIAKVKYQHITSGRAVPRFPVFVEVL